MIWCHISSQGELWASCFWTYIVAANRKSARKMNVMMETLFSCSTFIEFAWVIENNLAACNNLIRLGNFVLDFYIKYFVFSGEICKSLSFFVFFKDLMRHQWCQIFVFLQGIIFFIELQKIEKSASMPQKETHEIIDVREAKRDEAPHLFPRQRTRHLHCYASAFLKWLWNLKSTWIPLRVVYDMQCALGTVGWTSST